MKFNPDYQSENNKPKENYLAGPKLNFEDAEKEMDLNFSKSERNRDIFDDPEYKNYVYEPFVDVLKDYQKDLNNLNKKIEEQEIRLKILEKENNEQNKEIGKLKDLLEKRERLPYEYFGGIKRVTYKYVEMPEDTKTKKKIVRKILETEEFKPEDFINFISEKFDVKTKN
ncbi:MAG: hypothetical protein ACOZAR_01535 [Patescibacteria group bacterium]